MKKFCWVVFFVGMGVLIYRMLNHSYAYQYDNDIQYKLFYSDNLNSDVKKYIGGIDEVIMQTATYEDSNVLTENYSFLTKFAVKFILLHSELYDDDIIYGDDYKYYDLNGIEKVTNRYVKIDTIYFVTDWYFGIRDYYIDSDTLYNDLVPLVDVSIYDFNSSIDDVSCYNDGELIKCNILYEDTSKYLFSFVVKNNVLKIKDVEVME